MGSARVGSLAVSASTAWSSWALAAAGVNTGSVAASCPLTAGSARAPTPATASWPRTCRTIPACSLMNPFRSRTAVTILSCVVAGNAKLRLALAQVNPTVGAVAENAALISAWLERARDGGADLVLFPGLAAGVSGGGPLSEAALPAGERRSSRRAGRAGARYRGHGRIRRAARRVGRPPPVRRAGARKRSATLLRDGRVEAVYRKRLPNYAVFDEQRYFEPGTEPLVVELAGTQVGLTICEDVWEPGPPASVEADRGAELIVCPSGSPVLPRQARRPRGDVARSGPRLWRRVRVLQPRRGPGRAGVRRRQLRRRRRRRARRGQGQFSEELLLVDLGGNGGPVAEPLSTWRRSTARLSSASATT